MVQRVRWQERTRRSGLKRTLAAPRPLVASFCRGARPSSSRSLAWNGGYRPPRDANIADTLGRADGTEPDRLDERCLLLLGELLTPRCVVLRFPPRVFHDYQIVVRRRRAKPKGTRRVGGRWEIEVLDALGADRCARLCERSENELAVASR